MKLDILGHYFGQGLQKLGVPERVIILLFHRLFLFLRPMTIGVRAAAFDDNGHVFLVKHTFVGGWYFPGGGLEHGETAIDALTKELSEEGNLTIIGAPELMSFYQNKKLSGRDHIVFFKCNVRQDQPKLQNYEIAESGFFPVDQLPDDVLPSVKLRLSELEGENEISPFWS